MGRREMPHPDMYALTQGDAAPSGLWTHIRQIVTAHATQSHMLCSISSTLKIFQNLPNAVLPLYITTGAAYDYRIFILMFL